MNAQKYKLRDYQIDAVNVAVAALHKETKPFVIQAATGAGKSLIIAEICHQINEPILILQPSKEILEQNYQKLLSYDQEIDAGIYSASKGRKEIRKFTFATIGSIYKKPDQFMHFKYVLIDECHGVDPKNLNGMLTSFLRAIKCTHVCGLTATPYRIDKVWSRNEWGELWATAGLKMVNRITHTPFFKKILFKIETGDLIKLGYLCPIEYYIDQVDLTELKINSTGADFTTESVDRYWKHKRRLQRMVQAIEYSHQNNERSLIFCSSIKQAETVSKDVLQSCGIRVPVVTGKTPLKDREQLIAEFKQGQIKHILNVGVFTTGFDMPVLDCIILARPTMSLALYYQMIGRGVRIDPERPQKVLQVYDLAGVVERLGRVETIRVRTEKGGFRDEVWSERGRMDGTELYSFKVKSKEKI
jgi:DNA repair protein RadD